MNKRILLVDSTDFISFPTGGTLIFDKQLLKVIPPTDIALVGITTQNIIIGQWTYIDIDNKLYEFFPILKISKSNKKPFIPIRLVTLLALIRYLPRIRKKTFFYVFSQTPQFLFALKKKHWSSICFCFAGVSNSVSLSRYTYLRFLGRYYEWVLFKTIKKNVDLTLAAADKDAIHELVIRSKGVLDKNKIYSFPTRFDSSIFKPMDKNDCRKLLNISPNKPTLVVVGRLSWVKGWDLLTSMIRLDTENLFDLIFVGDGEDRSQIETNNSDLIKIGKLKITGFVQQEQVVKYINAADVVLVASYHEGWSTSMLESLACGKPLVSTNVSGASDLINIGKNGFILFERNPTLLLDLIQKAMDLPDAYSCSINIASKFNIENLYQDLNAILKK